ncbi:MAG: metal ABC transporter substrate-binding protein [Candidatus Nomurabacteria bacterium]|nr:metal ABC transporter substrate-binding protein [Candidatus Nomurabacteria bacterium]USN88238.1 MAG: metal ABC transporter substrate-binding protein [Candidatus Nomurabacteria bacterium]
MFNNKAFLTGAIIAIVIGVLFIVGKNAENSPKQEGDKIVVLSTFTIIADMVNEIGGDRVESLSLIEPGVNIHSYEPTPSDLVRASRADILLENGMNLELWTNKLKANMPDVPSVIVSEGVEPLSIVEGAYEGKPNPHAWMSPKQGLKYVENIRKTLVEFSPADEDYFNANAAAYSAKLEALDKTLNDSLSVLPENNRYLVTCEGAFTYLTNDYGLQEIYIWPINSDTAGSPQQVAAVIDKVKANHVPAVFCESTVSPKIQEEVVQATGARMGGVLYVDSLSTAYGPAPTYLTLLQSTVDTIVSGLSDK